MSTLEERLDRIERKLDTLLAAMKNGAPAAARGASSGGNTAPMDGDVDIDGPRGDPEVRFMPKRWTGQDFRGQKFSACEPEFLDMLADAFEWFAQRDDESGATDKNGGPKSKWGRLDAARARAWAARLRGDEGGSAPAPRARSNGGGGGFGGGGGGGGSTRRNAPPPAPARSNGGGMSDSFGSDDDIPF